MQTETASRRSTEDGARPLPERFGGYDLEALIGRGGMAEVFRARKIGETAAAAPVAVKRLLPQLARDALAADLFICEADITRYLDHPNIVRVLDTGYVADTFFVTTEYVEGLDLRQLLWLAQEHGRRLDTAVCCYVAHEVARGLDHAHRARGPNGTPLHIVHCDLSPANVLMSRDGAVKLTDFGVARASYGTPLPDGAIAGKQRYLAPEQVLGEPPSAATDVFGAGAVLFEMLAGEPAFGGERTEVVLDNIARGKSRKLRGRDDVPQAVHEVLARALARRRPGEPVGVVARAAQRLWPTPTRFATTAEFADAIEAAMPEAAGARPILARTVRDMLAGRRG